MMKYPAWLNNFLDRTIYFSFDKSGYKRHMQFANLNEKLSASSKNILITGANSGLGFATAKSMLNMGADVYFTTRDKKKGIDTARSLFLETANSHIFNLELDLNDLESVSKFSFNPPLTKLDVLIHNAGSMPETKITTKTPYESIFVSQVLAPFILTKKLIEDKKLTAGSRVIFVSSGGMYLQKLDLAYSSKDPYNKYRAYANAKRAQIILTALFAEKYPDILFSAMHPGWVDTAGVKKYMPLFYKMQKMRFRTLDQGIDTIVWLALREQKYTNGAFWFDRMQVSPHLFNFTKESVEDKLALFKLCEDYSLLFL